MILSYRHRFIFLHCRKVAGSAIQLYLSNYLGDNDIQLGTRFDFAEHGIERQNPRYYRDIRSAQGLRLLAGRVLHSPKCLLPRNFSDTLARVHKDVYKERFNSPYTGHVPAVYLRDFDRKAWDGFFKFCFVRNPYERAVSDYNWRVRARGKETGFREYLESVQRKIAELDHVSSRYDNWQIYTIDDEIAVDFVGRYENLHDDFRHACERIGLPAGELPVAKKGATRHDYRDYYGAREKALVSEIYRKEIEYFGYEF